MSSETNDIEWDIRREDTRGAGKKPRTGSTCFPRGRRWLMACYSGRTKLSEASGLGAKVGLTSLGCNLVLAQVYAKVEVDPVRE